MRVTTLIENRPDNNNPDLKAEWGLSLHIEFNGRNILFDTGSSGSFAENAEHLSIDIPSIEAAVLSHHHFDHGGGLKRFFELNKKAKVYLGEAREGVCFCKVLGFMKKDIGLDQAVIKDNADRFITVKEPTEILPGVFVFPQILSNHPKPLGNKRLYVKNGSSFNLDNFNHEIVMAIKEGGKLAVFTGCSHNGILNMIDTVAEEFKEIPIKTVIGGFHLVSTPPFNLMAGSRSEVEKLAEAVLKYPVEMTYTGHCTGMKAFSVLKGVMGDRIADIQTGSCFEI
jgi:7,8-dihydropterin-6-yl-methyl-4-(beta-D-ribofuranosyl)aminobenzene 5'-phosphate synthase